MTRSNFMRQRRIRLTEEMDETIVKLSEELNQSYSQTVRDLISISWTLMYSSDKITLRDLLIGSKDKLVDLSMPLSREMIEVEEDKEREGDSSGQG